MSCTLAFGSAAGGLPVCAVAAVVFVRALGTTLHTPAFNALTPMLAPPEMLGRLAGIQQFMQSGSYILGNAIAAVLYPMFGVTAMVALDVAGAVIASVAVAISGVETPRVHREQVDQVEPGRCAGSCGIPSRATELRRHAGLFAMLWIGFAFPYRSVPFPPCSRL